MSEIIEKEECGIDGCVTIKTSSSEDDYCFYNGSKKFLSDGSIRFEVEFRDEYDIDEFATVDTNSCEIIVKDYGNYYDAPTKVYRGCRYISGCGTSSSKLVVVLTAQARITLLEEIIERITNANNF